jgi:Protein of unknown function (DUF1553)/Protein of unknown function (DUF1549)/Planctomycete cytochrome C
MSLHCKPIQSILFTLASMAATCAFAQSQTAVETSPALTAEQLNFFESKIRPVLVEHCYSCHGPEVDKVQGGLRLDQRMGWQAGGDSGDPSIIPGDPTNSPLLKAIKHDGAIAAMPPDLPPLPASIVSDLSHWIEMGAPDPRDQPIERQHKTNWAELFEQRSDWWSLKPVVSHPAPTTMRSDWARTEMDAFILAKLEAGGLQPQPEADRATLARRLSFALTGIPPASEVVRAFVQDDTVDAYSTLVDKLLASPQFGERWARHWLDVVHYSDTHGYEWDAPAKNAYMYRDYVVRAFNCDLPISDFFVEQIAGDLIEPRIDKALGLVESLIGPMSLRLGERRHGDNIDAEGISQEAMANVIDTFGKGFLGTTVACAQCHDHKLDAVPQRDYYALAGVFMSTRWPSTAIDSYDKNTAVISELRSIKQQIQRELLATWTSTINEIPQRLKALPVDEKPSPAFPESLAALWQRSLNTPLTAEEYQAERLRRKTENQNNLTLIADFTADSDLGTGGWQWEGSGLQNGLVQDGELIIADEGENAITGLLAAGRWTHVWSGRLAGALRSPLFTQSPPVTFSIQGAGAHHPGFSFIVDGAIHSERMQFLNRPQLGWLTQTAGNFTSLEGSTDQRSRRLYFEMVTKAINNYFPPRTAYGGLTEDNVADPRSWFGVTRIYQHPAGKPPLDELDRFAPLFAATSTWDARISDLILASIDRWEQGQADADSVQVINEALQLNLLPNSLTINESLRKWVNTYRTTEQRVIPDTIVGSMADWREARDERIGVRGSYTDLADEVPRGCLTLLSPLQNARPDASSGRAELAQVLVNRSNPLTARVFVNRVWQHLFGEGLVRTPDDFGHLGELPSHPELLDCLVQRFVSEGWSLKKLVKQLVCSATWRQQSVADPQSLTVDPENRLLHHFSICRLEAESIRDALLVVSGHVDSTIGGPPIDPYRTAQDRAKRLLAGPLDSHGRRSLYIKTTMMEPARFMALFNQPIPKLTTGRRDVTSVPDQALALLNDPLVLALAKQWGERLVVDQSQSIEQRIASMVMGAFSREVRNDELARFLQLADRSGEIRRVDVMTSPLVWQDVAHAVFNMKEFIHVR